MTLRLPDKTAVLVQKLIRLMASDQDGEVLSAVRKLAGVLGRAGKSFHDLADQVQAGVETVRPAEPTPPWHRPQQAWTPAETWGEDTEVDEEQEEELKPPVYAALKQYQRLAWLQLVLERQKLETADEDATRVLIEKIDLPATDRRMTGYLLNRQEERLFNRLVNRAWRVGLRI